MAELRLTLPLSTVTNKQKGGEGKMEPKREPIEA